MLLWDESWLSCLRQTRKFIVLSFNTLRRRVVSFRIYTPTTTACRSLDHQIGGDGRDYVRIVLSQSKIRSNWSCCPKSLLIGRRSIVLTVHDTLFIKKSNTKTFIAKQFFHFIKSWKWCHDKKRGLSHAYRKVCAQASVYWTRSMFSIHQEHAYTVKEIWS